MALAVNAEAFTAPSTFLSRAVAAHERFWSVGGSHAPRAFSWNGTGPQWLAVVHERKRAFRDALEAGVPAVTIGDACGISATQVKNVAREAGGSA